MANNAPERESDIGLDESYTVNLKGLADIAIGQAAKVMAEMADQTRRNAQHFDKLVSDAQQFDNARQLMANQALQNAIETANMVGKQAVRHGDIAIDRQWNPDEVARITELVNAILAERLPKEEGEGRTSG